MAASTYSTTQYTSSDFVISAGSVLFRNSPDSGGLQICLIHNEKKDEWLLPKGRKDCGETIAAAAVRETYEETGYACRLLPCLIPTQAPTPGVESGDIVQNAASATEPITVTVRHMGEKGVKLIFWYVTAVTGEYTAGTQMNNEHFESQFVDADKAVARLTFQGDRDIAARAADLLKRDSTISSL